MFTNKIYENYFPIETEEQKKEFLENNRIEIIKFLKLKYNEEKGMYLQISMKYISRLKDEVSPFGNIKYKNISHNKAIVLKMQLDYRLEELNQKIKASEELLYALKYSEDISVDKINEILESMESIHCRDHFRVTALIVLAVVCLLLYL